MLRQAEAYACRSRYLISTRANPRELRRASPLPSLPTSIAASRSCHHLLRQSRCHRIMIAERQHMVSNNLSGLVALAGDQEHIALGETGDGLGDRLGTVADFACALCSRHDRRADEGRIFAARIVIGNDDLVGIVG